MADKTDKKLMIVDCDTGVDDAHAILMAVSHPGTHLLAITCVQGNVGVDQVCCNVGRTLDACKQDGFVEPVPIYKGASHSILNHPVTNHNFHGKDGLGDSPCENTIEYKVGRHRHPYSRR
ncbi:nucleoside hydrolase-like [Amphiura filiformis]|uniref:nucleoside hydrolase-like n=1 Tax=Amphiura filiformis TaxID=82378 RepID=UPI003B2227DB